MPETVSPIAQEGVGAVEADSAIVEVWTYLRAIGVSGIISIGSWFGSSYSDPSS